MDKKYIWAAGVVAVVGVAGYLVFTLGTTPPSPETPAVPPPVARPAPAEPSIRYPIEAPAPTATPLPALDASDGAVAEAVTQLLGAGALPDFLYPDQMVRRFVATIDNLPRARASSRMMPVKPVAGAFKTTGTEKTLAIDPANAARYRLYVGVIEKMDVPQWVGVYVRFYPLFQQAYQELGYPKGYFNDRLVEALDDLLEAPALSGSVALVQPNVLYLYADPELEERSAGQKIMMRMGNDNAERVKVVLRAIREEVVRRASPAAPAP